MKDDFYYEVRKKLDQKRMGYEVLSEATGVTTGRISQILLRQCSYKARQQYIPIIAKELDIEDSKLPDDIKPVEKIS